MRICTRISITGVRSRLYLMKNLNAIASPRGMQVVGFLLALPYTLGCLIVVKGFAH